MESPPRKRLKHGKGDKENSSLHSNSPGRVENSPPRYPENQNGEEDFNSQVKSPGQKENKKVKEKSSSKKIIPSNDIAIYSEEYINLPLSYK